MLFFNLKLIRKTDSLFILTIPLYTRIIILFFALAVASTFALDPGFALLPFIITIILLVTALYEEYWSFDGDKKEVISRFGLVILSRKTVVNFKQIEKIQLEGFVRGSLTQKPEADDTKKKKFFQTEYFKLSLLNSVQGELTINTVKGRQRDKLLECARQIADLCGKPLIEL